MFYVAKFVSAVRGFTCKKSNEFDHFVGVMGWYIYVGFHFNSNNGGQTAQNYLHLFCLSCFIFLGNVLYFLEMFYISWKCIIFLENVLFLCLNLCEDEMTWMKLPLPFRVFSHVQEITEN